MIGSISLVTRWCSIILKRTFHFHIAVVLQDVHISHNIHCCIGCSFLLWRPPKFMVRRKKKAERYVTIDRSIRALSQDRSKLDNQNRLEMSNFFLCQLIRKLQDDHVKFVEHHMWMCSEWCKARHCTFNEHFLVSSFESWCVTPRSITIELELRCVAHLVWRVSVRDAWFLVFWRWTIMTWRWILWTWWDVTDRHSVTSPWQIISSEAVRHHLSIFRIFENFEISKWIDNMIFYMFWRTLELTFFVSPIQKSSLIRPDLIFHCTICAQISDVIPFTHSVLNGFQTSLIRM